VREEGKREREREREREGERKRRKCLDIARRTEGVLVEQTAKTN